ncbi:MAG: RNB domain-containing ribonuclease [Betaproteobacteria bacterium]|nr:RNB domain-containing ribonuclease [Betaproteobacteria bacterium]
MPEFVFYEEDGGFKSGSVMSDIGTSLQVEAVSGKRSKIKSGHVLLRFASPGLVEFAQASQARADEIDPDFLWQVCGPDEFGFADLAHDYYGHAPSAVEAAAVAIKLHASPMYFYKKGKGRYKAAPEENLKAALASLEKKQRQAEQIATWVAELKTGRCPDALKSQVTMLLYKPDRNTLEMKALEQACAETGLTPVRLLASTGALTSHHDHHLKRFLVEYFPEGRDADVKVSLSEYSHPPFANIRTFSIDDEETTEIDDAFSVVARDEGGWRIGVHIAAPAVLFDRESSLEALAAKRLSTVYFPGDKITMLPPNAVATGTLAAGNEVPVVSLYVDVNADLSLGATHSTIERVTITANIRIQELAARFTPEHLAADTVPGEFGRELAVLWRIANQLKTLRGDTAEDLTGKVDYNFAVENDRVAITTRQRGNPIDLTVSEWMIFANSTWGKLLADHGVAAIYRSQSNGRTRMSLEALPHEGLGVAQYAWSTSPLRRYVDLANQRQLVALLSQQTPHWPKRSPELVEVARRFELTYDAYNEFQRGMERYWVLRWFHQEGATRFAATVLREDLVRAKELPLVTRVPGMTDQPAGTHVWIEVADIDFWAPDATFRFAGRIDGRIEGGNDNAVQSP